MRKNPISKVVARRVGNFINDKRIIYNHPLQRSSEQWSKEQKGNLIRRILHEGEFLPLLICTQQNDKGVEESFLIDGVQRATSIREYVNGDYAISKNILDYMIGYDGVLYETKATVNGKFSLKRDRSKNLIPVFDENGNEQIVPQEIDIRGLKFNDLPPELQERILDYTFEVIYKYDCTDEDIQIEIIDYNAGTPMNAAQIGKNALGADLAKQIDLLTEHPFIMDKCGFTHTNDVKAITDRSITEALMLVNFGAEKWVSNYKVLCQRLAESLTVNGVKLVTEIFNELDDVIPEDDAIKSYLTNKEFFIVVSNYKYFRDLGYSNDCYAQFLDAFVKELKSRKTIATGDIDDAGDEIYRSFEEQYMTSGKQKDFVASRLNKMNEMLVEWLENNSEKSDETDDDVEDAKTTVCAADENALSDFIADFSEINLPFRDEKTALKSLMDFTSYSPYQFGNANLSAFRSWIATAHLNEQYEDCLFRADNLQNYIARAGAWQKFDSDDIAILTTVLSEFDDDYSDDDIIEWMINYKNDCGLRNNADSAEILERCEMFKNNIKEFMEG